jgi:prolyl oligopeptidase
MYRANEMTSRNSSFYGGRRAGLRARGAAAAGAIAIALSSLSVTAAAAGDPTFAELNTPDKFTWLSAAHDPAAVQWAAKQSQATMQRLTSSPEFPKVQEEIRRAEAASSPTPNFYLLGDKLVKFVRDDRFKAGAFFVAPRAAASESKTIAWKMVLDVAALNAKESRNYQVMFLGLNAQCLPPKYDRCLIPFGEGGSSLVEYREFDFSNGQFVEGGFRSPPTRGDFAWLNPDTILIGYNGKPSDELPSGFPQNIVAWRRGTDINAAKTVYSAKRTDSLVSATTIGTGSSQRGLLNRAMDYSNFELELVNQNGSVERLDLPTRLQNFGTAFVTGNLLVVQLAEPATIEGKAYAADTLVAYDISAPAGHHVSLVFAPSAGSYVNDPFNGIVGTGDGIAFVQTHNLQKSLLTAHRTAGGWTTTRSLSAPPGVAMTITSHDSFGPSVIVEEAGFLQPTQTSIITPGHSPVALFNGKPVVDASAFVTDIRSAKSKDGTMVDYYLVRPKHPKPGPVPVIISGYGGYGINVDPDYFAHDLGVGLVPWLLRGGAFSIAAIRGGGERGSAWANSAKGVNRQRTFDDFAAVAKDMVLSRFTAPGKIGSFGRSFGGLLSSNMVTQQPHLFGAAIVGVPITDLFRGVDDGSVIAAGQETETGNPHDPKQVPIMLRYSPYQNIQAGTQYPHVLTIVSTEDGQVGPGYGRRFTAKLQSVGADAMLLEGPTGGHGFPNEFANPREYAAQVTFFIDSLMK